MPKTYRHLYPRIYAFENLYLAHRKARRGGKRRRAAVAEFERNLGENLLRLRGEDRRQVLLEADVELETLKALLRLGQERRYMNLRQYQHVSAMLADVGRQLGSWRASIERQQGQ